MKSILKYLPFLSLLLVVGCRDNVEPFFPEFAASMDLLKSYDEDSTGSKVLLYHEEEWTRWEQDDELTIFALDDDYKSMASLGSARFEYHEGEAYNKGTFRIPEGGDGINAAAKHYFAVFPAAFAPASIAANTPTINLGHTVTYRANDSPSDNQHPDNSNAGNGDHSFGASMFPMVGYHHDGGRTGMDSLRFHTVAGIMRIQVWRPASLSAYTIKDIKLTSIGNASGAQNLSYAYKLSGSFNVQRYRDNNPYVQSAFCDANSSGDASVTYQMADSDNPRTIGGANGKLWTFYIPLPAQGTAKDQTTHYMLRMTLHLHNATQGDRYFHKGIKVDIHRQNITMMPAISIDESDVQLSTSATWPAGGTATNGEVCIVGNGTIDRPFRIYTGAELDRVRQAFTSSSPSINGIPVTENTYFKVVRSDIRLMPTQASYDALDAAKKKGAVVWTEGIRNFKGNMEFKSASTTRGGIINMSTTPLFESISEEGTVERMQIRGNVTYNTGGNVFSPLCKTNNGTMIDCHVKDTITSTNGKNIAALCVTNNGTIVGGANEAPLTTNADVSGCVWENNGMLQGSFSLSSAVPVGNNIAGICMHNYGRMQFCQVESNISPNSQGNWGIIAFYNHAYEDNNGVTRYGIVDRCISSGSVVFTTTGSIGGIVHTNEGIVKNSSNKVTLRGASGAVGGIVSVMTGGEVYNCDAEGNHWIDGNGGISVTLRATYAGGIVGHLEGGAIRNSYNHCRVDGAIKSGGIVGSFDEGSVIENCWTTYRHNFIGDDNFTGRNIIHCFSGFINDYSYYIDFTNITGCNIVDTNTRCVIDNKHYLTDVEYGCTTTYNGTTSNDHYFGYYLQYWVENVGNAANSAMPLDKADGGSYCGWTWTVTHPSDVNVYSLPSLNFSNTPSDYDPTTSKVWRRGAATRRSATAAHRSTATASHTPATPRRTSDSFSPSVKQRFKHSR